ncbi:HAD family phosphatase [Streptomyces sp. A3M-1-3]|uniref:HAD family phosphatase n=1 Tax=Streptomyces sp. A3M-1-3 TaxID=2962044 RepID=UPI0020B84893|nr:HAD family phosphatase [Streptomyces sp. A3M-1-3]MCP3822819.1 HAD family phosphatase [Streptomyces sp. A3M-1-3]
MQPLQRLRLAAVNIDGVLLSDTFSPVIHRFVTSRGGRYDAAVEREIFSQSQMTAATALGAAAGVTWPPEQVLKTYFEERAEYLAGNPLHVLDGAVDLLLLLRRLGLSVVCYGGLEKTHFDRYLGERASLFDGPKYICTNDFRPGIREIAVEAFGLGFDQAVFIDDVARVAEAAKALGVPFIGHPSSFEHGFQAQLMRAAGVRHLVRSLPEIDEALLCMVDAEAAAGRVWTG